MKYCCEAFKLATYEGSGIITHYKDYALEREFWAIMGFDSDDAYVPLVDIYYCPFCGKKLK